MLVGLFETGRNIPRALANTTRPAIFLGCEGRCPTSVDENLRDFHEAFMFRWRKESDVSTQNKAVRVLEFEEVTKVDCVKAFYQLFLSLHPVASRLSLGGEVYQKSRRSAAGQLSFVGENQKISCWQ